MPLLRLQPPNISTKYIDQEINKSAYIHIYIHIYIHVPIYICIYTTHSTKNSNHSNHSDCSDYSDHQSHSKAAPHRQISAAATTLLLSESLESFGTIRIIRTIRNDWNGSINMIRMIYTV